jgi:hypothetical protein
MQTNDVIVHDTYFTVNWPLLGGLGCLGLLVIVILTALALIGIWWKRKSPRSEVSEPCEEEKHRP